MDAASGLLFVLIGGVLQGSFVLPMTRVRLNTGLAVVIRAVLL